MKRWVSCLPFAAVLCVAAAGCGGAPDDPATPAAPVEASPEDSPAPEFAACDEDLETVMAALSDRWAKVNSFKADVTLMASMPIGPTTVSTNGSGTVEALRSGERWKMRMETTSDMEAGIPGLGSVEAKTVTVSDGKTSYLETTMMGKTKVGRKPIQGNSSSAVSTSKDLLEDLRRDGEVSLLGLTTVNGIEAYAVQTVLDEKARQGKPGNPVRSVICFAKDTAIRVRVQVFDQEGESLTELVYNNVLLNPEIDPDVFNYTPPVGIEVQAIEIDEESLEKPPV